MNPDMTPSPSQEAVDAAPCPFCGQNAIMWQDDVATYGECERCDIWLPIKLWNERIDKSRAVHSKKSLDGRPEKMSL